MTENGQLRAFLILTDYTNEPLLSTARPMTQDF